MLDYDIQNEGIVHLSVDRIRTLYILTFEGKTITLVSAEKEIGLLYGTFRFLKELQLHQPIEKIAITDSPKIQKRVLNHWDNLDRTVERGYAGFSIWDWHLLPELIKPEYIDYARANASVGINGTVLTNVNANSLVLSPQYIEKVQALADVFRPYGIQVYLTARFSSPVETGDLETADPLDPEVRKWWKNKADEIYQSIPDFGGFLVKANSEGQPGPNNYGRTHVDGANMMAEALAPHNGIVMWRAFVYSEDDPEDRATALRRPCHQPCSQILVPGEVGGHRVRAPHQHRVHLRPHRPEIARLIIDPHHRLAVRIVGCDHSTDVERHVENLPVCFNRRHPIPQGNSLALCRIQIAECTANAAPDFVIPSQRAL